MKYLGIDVHVKASVWCLLDEAGEVLQRGTTSTTWPDITALLTRLVQQYTDLVAGQESGKMAHFVYDIFVASGVKLLSFNAYHLRMIASSRKKTDRRDAYWIAKAMQTGMTPHPVYIPTGEVRLLRNLLSQRSGLMVDRRRWLARARSHLHAAGYKTKVTRSIELLIQHAVAIPTAMDPNLRAALDMCVRMEKATGSELEAVEKRLLKVCAKIDDIQRLKTIPGIGEVTATAIYAWVGDISRFPNARSLGAYAGLVPSVRQSGDSNQNGAITKEGTKQLRSSLVQCGHVLMARCHGEDARPLRQIADRIQATRTRRKIAVVATARHLLRIAYYVLRDGTEYQPELLRSAEKHAA